MKQERVILKKLREQNNLTRDAAANLFVGVRDGYLKSKTAKDEVSFDQKSINEFLLCIREVNINATLETG